MAVYLVLLGITVFTFVLGHVAGDKKRVGKNTILVFFTGMVILIWLRSSSVGTDTWDYIAIYNRAKDLGFSDVLKAYTGEYGYFALNMLTAAIYDDYHFLFLCIALISLVPVMRFYARKSENALISIGLFLLFLFPMYFSGMRQICAMAFVFPAYYAAQQKKRVRFVLCVVAAMAFHRSAFILALLYPVYRMKIKKIWFPFVAVLFVFAYTLRTQIFTAVLSFLPARYQESYGELTETSAVAVLLLMVICVVYTYITTDENKLDEEAIGLRNLLVLSMVLQMFVPLNNIAMRLNYYYLLLVPVTMSKYVHLANVKFAAIAREAERVLAVFFIGYFIVNMYVGADVLRIFPYRFYFTW